jgi:hypothetical protein
MDLKSLISRIASDCDMRTRFIHSVPNFLDNYLLSGTGELITKDEANRVSTFNYFLDGMDFVSSQVSKI